MKHIKQFRYYSSTSSNNYPALSNYYGILSVGNLFASHGGISQLGIQALPGTKFYLNNSATPIIIGFTGIYELDLEGISEITSISFDRDSLSAISNINNAYLIVDAIYNVEEG